MFDQVNINLPKYKNTLRSLATIREVQEAPKLQEDWDKVSKFWKSEPSMDSLSIFVKIPSTGEQKFVALMEHYSLL